VSDKTFMGEDMKSIEERVEEAWYLRTKGELWLSEEVHGEERDEDLAALVFAMDSYVRDFHSTEWEHFDGEGNSVTGAPSDDEIARRIAAAIDILSYGGPA
jgi:hypothetical protein